MYAIKLRYLTIARRLKGTSMLSNISIKWKGILIVLLCLLGIGTQEYLSINNAREIMIEEKKVKLKEVVKFAIDNVTYFANLAERQLITEDAAKEQAKEMLRHIRYTDNNDYIFVYDFNGNNLVTGTKTELEGKNLIDLKDKNGVALIAELINAAKIDGGFVNYIWERNGKDTPKLSYSMGYKPWSWMIGTGVYIDDIDQAFYNNLQKALINLGILIIIIGGFTALVVRNIINPILLTSEQMTKISNKEKTVITGTDREDELGTMSRTLLNLQESIEKQSKLEAEMSITELRKREENKSAMNNLANLLDKQVGSIVTIIEQTAEDLQNISNTLTSTSEKTSHQSYTVAKASQLASANVQTVAAASEELSASIQDLVKNISDTATATRKCTKSAQISQNYLKVLQVSVDEIDSVIQSINGVASQTNLLALNATIEAARAGEMGKGFAVVANEVKTLSSATNKMTEEIAKKISDIKISASDTIISMQDIMKQIESVDERTTSISSAIEEQNASTAEISRSAQEASSCTSDVYNSIGEVQLAAKDTALSTEQLKNAADSLSEQSTALQMAIATFISEVRTS